MQPNNNNENEEEGLPVYPVNPHEPVPNQSLWRRILSTFDEISDVVSGLENHLFQQFQYETDAITEQYVFSLGSSKGCCYLTNDDVQRSLTEASDTNPLVGLFGKDYLAEIVGKDSVSTTTKKDLHVKLREIVYSGLNTDASLSNLEVLGEQVDYVLNLWKSQKELEIELDEQVSLGCIIGLSKQIGITGVKMGDEFGTDTKKMTDYGNWIIMGNFWNLARDIKEKLLLHKLRCESKEFLEKASKGSILGQLETAKGEVPQVVTEEAAVDTVILLLYDQQNISIPLQGCLYELGRNNKIQELLRNEVIEMRKEEAEGKTTLAKYLNDETKLPSKIWLESCRMYPAIPILSRTSLDSAIECKGVVIPAHCMVLMSNWHRNRNPTKFEDAAQFNPLRDDLNADNLGVFGKGDHHCIGRFFAAVFFKLWIVKMVESFAWSADNKDPKVQPVTALHFVDKLKIYKH